MILDNLFGIHSAALLVRGRRAELLATNIANADTPGYRARDIDFAQVMQTESDMGARLATTDARHIAGGDPGLGGAEVLYRNPSQPSLDGNTVDTQVEEAEFTKNTMQYQASLEFLNQRIRGLQLALRGE